MRTLDATHTYDDDDPTATPEDAYASWPLPGGSLVVPASPPGAGGSTPVPAVVRFDALDGRASVQNEDGDDWTEGMLRGA